MRSLAILVIKSRQLLVPYLPQAAPALLHALRVAEPSTRRNIVKDLGTIVFVFGVHYRAHLQPLLDALLDLWMPRPSPTVRAHCGLYTGIIVLTFSFSVARTLFSNFFVCVCLHVRAGPRTAPRGARGAAPGYPRLSALGD